MNVASLFRRKKTIQLALGDLAYAQWLRSILQHDGEHKVHLVDKPDLRLGGIVVVDEETLERLSPILDPHRFVVFVRNGTDSIARIWEAGIRRVVYEGSTVDSAHLTILSAELNLPTSGPAD